MSSLTISLLAKRADVPIDTIRYNERSGLIDTCPGHGEAERCPILAALNEDPS